MPLLLSIALVQFEADVDIAFRIGVGVDVDLCMWHWHADGDIELGIPREVILCTACWRSAKRRRAPRGTVEAHECSRPQARQYALSTRDRLSRHTRRRMDFHSSASASSSRVEINVNYSGGRSSVGSSVEVP